MVDGFDIGDGMKKSKQRFVSYKKQKKMMGLISLMAD
jgi:hypothetical protein